MADYTNIALDTLTNALKQIKIGDNVYPIKDSRVDTLVIDVNTKLSGINTRINTLEGKTWTAVNKPNDAAKYATSVTQGTDGSISVTYSNVRDSAFDAGVQSVDSYGGYANVIVGITQNTDGSITATSTTAGQLTAYDGAMTDDLETILKAHKSEFNTVATGAQTYTDTAITGVIGAQGDATSADTIWGVKNYAKAQAEGAQTAAINAVNALAGQDWAANAGTVMDIIAELKADGSSVANLDTIIDKLRGNFDYTTGPEGAQTTTHDVKSYIDGKVEEARSAASGGISDLDAEVTSIDGTNVQVKVTEVDGKITAVNVTTDNTINATDLSNKVGAIGDNTTVKDYVDAQVAGKNVSASSSTTDYITASATNNAVTVAATQKLIDAVAAAEAALPAAKVQKGQITYLQSASYDSTTESLTFTPITDANIVTPTSNWTGN